MTKKKLLMFAKKLSGADTKGMRIDLPPVGTYVVAVSGGVDSVVLLDLLATSGRYELVVAHLDHGIREESAEDAAFVRDLAEKYGLPFESERVELGPGASEDEARRYRYAFLRRIQECRQAEAIVTAHHLDDDIETAIMQSLRGSRAGFGILPQPGLLRPLLGVRKQALVRYARRASLQWREDTTNQDSWWLRNFVRLQLLPLLRQQQPDFDTVFASVLAEQKSEMLERLEHLEQTLPGMITQQESDIFINRHSFLRLIPSDARMVLRRSTIEELDHERLERLRVFIGAGKPGTRLALGPGIEAESRTRVVVVPVCSKEE